MKETKSQKQKRAIKDLKVITDALHYYMGEGMYKKEDKERSMMQRAKFLTEYITVLSQDLKMHDIELWHKFEDKMKIKLDKQRNKNNAQS